MFFSKTMAGSLMTIVFSGFAPDWIHATETVKNPAADRIVVPTKIKPLDINSASMDNLKALPGISEAYAQKIVENRPYRKKDELISKKIVPEATFKKIKDRIIAVSGSGS
jgi:DNA uptake protein ComE-like DNA-binding protein